MAIFITLVCDIVSFKFKKTTKVVSYIKLICLTLLAIGTLVVLIQELNISSANFANISVYINFETLQEKLFIEQAQNVLKISFLTMLLFAIFSFYCAIQHILLQKNSTKLQNTQSPKINN